jgi:hypothetical protein
MVPLTPPICKALIALWLTVATVSVSLALFGVDCFWAGGLSFCLTSAKAFYWSVKDLRAQQPRILGRLR